MVQNANGNNQTGQRKPQTNLGAAIDEHQTRVAEAAAAQTQTQTQEGATVITVQPKDVYESFRGLLERQKDEIAKVLPSHMDTARLLRIIMTAFRTNPDLMDCTTQSVLGAVMQLAQLGLEPILNLAHLIPYNNKKTGKKECQMIIGYRGYQQLAMRTNEIQLIKLHEVYQGDEFSYEYGLEPKLIHKPAPFSSRGEVVYFYARMLFKNGTQDFMVMYREDIDAIRDAYSVGYKFNKANSPWQTDYLAMARKTLLKQFLKYAPISIDTIEKLEKDEGVFTITDKTERLLGITETHIQPETNENEE